MNRRLGLVVQARLVVRPELTLFTPTHAPAAAE
jgi:hypothetical protein